MLKQMRLAALETQSLFLLRGIELLASRAGRDLGIGVLWFPVMRVFDPFVRSDICPVRHLAVVVAQGCGPEVAHCADEAWLAAICQLLFLSSQLAPGGLNVL